MLTPPKKDTLSLLSTVLQNRWKGAEPCLIALPHYIRRCRDTVRI